MSRYYVNENAQETGEHEVHIFGCIWLEMAEDKKFLGIFPSCQEAIAKASKIYLNVDGCKYCCPDCHNI